MESRPFSRKSVHSNRAYVKIAIVTAILFVFLIGCEYTALPTLIPTLAAPQNTGGTPNNTSMISSVYLPDGSEVFIRLSSEIAFNSVSGINPDLDQDVISLHSGEVLVKSRLPQGIWFTVLSPHGYIARVTGSIMLVTFDPTTDSFTVICILGHCQIGPDENRLTDMGPGDKGWLDLAGNFQGPVAADIGSVGAIYGDDNLNEEPVPTATITETLTETPTETPTELFTATSSPTPTISRTPTKTPNLRATATAACIIFHTKYPSTPCPK